jgi:hypothetical protein
MDKRQHLDASCERLSEGFMARVFESRHLYSSLNIGFAPPFTDSDRVNGSVVRVV